MNADDDLASVRIVVDGAGKGAPDAPDVDPSSSGPPTGLIALGLLLVVVLVGVVVFLRPDGDQAADGTERAVPTTTIPPVDDDAEDAEDNEPVEELIGPTITPVRIDSADNLSEIILTEFGLLGLGEGVPNGELPLFRSSDGIDWVEAEIAPDEAFDEQGADRFWFFLNETDAGISVSSQDFAFGSGRSAVSYFASSDGARWQPGEEFVPPGDETGLFPVGTRSGSVLSLRQVGNQRLTEVLNEHTTIDLLGAVACSSAAVEDGVLVRTCDNEEFQITEDEVTSGADPVQIVACLSEVGQGFFPPLEIVLFGGGDSIERLSGLDGGLTALPVELSTGQFALAERELPEDELEDASCEGVIDPRPARPASVLIVGGDAPARRIAVPVTVEGEASTAQVLGEVPGDGDEEASLVIVVAGFLWQLDLATDTWTQIPSNASPESTSGSAEFILSESGDRAYRIDARFSTFTTFRFSRSEDGSISVSEITSLIELEEEVAIDFNGGRALYADDSAVFFAGGRSVAVWRLPVPLPGGR